MKVKWKWNKLALIWFDAAIQIRNTSVSSFSFTEQSDFFLLTKYRISSVLFSPLDRKHPHCFMYWVFMIFLKCNVPTWQWPFSAFFIEVSLYTSKPISIRLASERDVKAYFSNPSANYSKVTPLFLTLRTIAILSVQPQMAWELGQYLLQRLFLAQSLAHIYLL